jgi:hypothetical protein
MVGNRRNRRRDRNWCLSMIGDRRNRRRRGSPFWKLRCDRRRRLSMVRDRRNRRRRRWWTRDRMGLRLLHRRRLPGLRQRARGLRLDRVNQVLHGERYGAEPDLIARQHGRFAQRRRFAPADQLRAIARSTIGQHQRSIIFQPDFSVRAADRIVGDGDVAAAVPADGESLGHGDLDSVSTKLRMGHYIEGGAGDLAACRFSQDRRPGSGPGCSLFSTRRETR